MSHPLGVLYIGPGPIYRTVVVVSFEVTVKRFFDGS